MTTSSVEGFRLSLQQRTLWTADGMAKTRVLITGPLDVERLAASVSAVVDGYEILRSTYERVRGFVEPVQVVHDDGRLLTRWEVVDLRGWEQSRQTPRLGEIMAQPLDGSVLKATLCALADDRHELLLAMPALAADPAALGLLGDVLARAYEDPVAAVAAATDTVQYTQYAEWQHTVAGEIEVAGYPHAGGPVSTVAGTLPAATAAGLRAAAARLGVGIDAVLLACWQVLRSRIGADGPIAVSCAGRMSADLRDCLGPVRRWVELIPQAGNGFDEIVRAVGAELTRIEQLGEVDLARAAVSPAPAPAFECTGRAQPVRVAGVEFVVVSREVDTAADLRLEVVVDESGIDFLWRFGRSVDEATVRAMAKQYAVLAGGLSSGAEPATASLMDPQDRERALAVARGLVVPASVACVHHLVERQVGLTPDALAVCVDGRAVLTYHELDERAIAIAGALRAFGARPGATVGVCLPYDERLPAGLLGVLKAGAAYVPLDPALPQVRLADMVRTAGCHIVLADAARIELLAEVLDGTGPEVVDVDRLPAVAAPVDAGAGQNDLAYVMFTSGSAGQPKGVMVPHRAVVNYLSWAGRVYDTAAGTALLHSSIGFDLTVTSVLAPLVRGGTVSIDAAWQSVGALAAELGSGPELAFLKVTPSHLTVLNASLPTTERITRVLVAGGEALTGEMIEPWHGHARIVNEYGPTEATVGCCAYEVPSGRRPGPVPIGRPIDNAEVLLLDEDMVLVPDGVPGELYLGGACLATGYLGAPDQTADRFVPHPFAAEEGARLYRTGDRALRQPDGDLVYLGRVDEQIKVRGVRVEPAEIRAALRRWPGIVDAAVVQSTDADRGPLVHAVYVGADIDETALRTSLARELPPHMLPDTLTPVAELPLTGNGKLDRAAVIGLGAPAARPPRPVEAATAGDVDLATTGNIAEIMADLLGVEEVAPDEDFFDLGGHSLLAVQLIARINARFGTELLLAVLFEDIDATPRRIATHVGGAAEVTDPCVVRLTTGEGAPVFCVQPAGVLGNVYRDVLDALPGRQSFGLVMPPRADVGDAPAVGDLAARLVRAIRAVRANGPYLVAGWSMGGVVAYEIVRQLAAAGERASLVLVDSYLAGELPTIDDSDVLRGFAAELTAAGLFTGDVETVAGLPFDAAADVLVRQGFTVDVERAEVVEHVATYRGALRAVAGYRPDRPPAPTPVTLVQAAGTDAGMRRSAISSWTGLVGEHLVVRTLDGDHFSVLHEPAAAELARIVESILKGLAQ